VAALGSRAEGGWPTTGRPGLVARLSAARGPGVAGRRRDLPRSTGRELRVFAGERIAVSRR